MRQNQERGGMRKTIGDVAMGIGLAIFDGAAVIGNIRTIESGNTGPIQIIALAIADGLCLLSTYWYATSLIPEKIQEGQERRQRRQRRSHEAFRRMPRDPHRNSRQRGR